MQTSRNLQFTVTVAVTSISSDNDATCYVFSGFADDVILAHNNG